MSHENGHSTPEMRWIAAPRERLKVLMDVVSRSYNSLANALISVLSAGFMNSWEVPEEAHAGAH